MSHALREPLLRALDIDEAELFEVDGLLDLKDLFDITRVPGVPDLRYEEPEPDPQPRLQATSEAGWPPQDETGR